MRTDIDHFRAAPTPQVALLDSFLGRTPLPVGDLIAGKVLQGVRDAREFESVKRTFDDFDRIEIAGYGLAVQASVNHRVLRSMGITVRKTIDALIATRCIEDGLTLLHADRDFLPFAAHLGLKEADKGH